MGGSFGGDLDTWSDHLAQNEEYMVPIGRKLALISQLFKKEWLSESEEYGFSQSLDADRIAKLFNTMAYRYCEEILKSTNCRENLKGCGLNSNCIFDETCINDPNESAGYRCER